MPDNFAVMIFLILLLVFLSGAGDGKLLFNMSFQVLFDEVLFISAECYADAVSTKLS